jgi:two-component system C4-dicarboxylate transport response regulator DctD
MRSASVYGLERQSERSVLIVEDEIVSRMALKRLLNGCGFDAQTYASAEEVLSKLNRDPNESPRIALVDVDLPGMSGLELVVKLEQASPDTCTILLTAHSGERIKSFQQAHAVGYLQKPINFHQLLSIIDEMSIGGAAMCS